MNRRLTVAAGLATVLASIALYPLIAGGDWFWGGIGAVIVAGAIGAATRRRMVPVAVCFLAAAGGQFLYLNALFARRQSVLDLVPTPASVHHLGLLVTQATAETHSPPPVPPHQGIGLVAVAGIGLVAVLTDLLAVRLHRPAIAGLPLLVLFCVPLTTPVKPGAVGTAMVFCVAVAGYLGLLSADSRYRLRLWGAVIHPWREDGETVAPDTSLLAATGRRIGLAAVVLALFVPVLMPAVRMHQLFGGAGGGDGGPGQGPAGAVSLPRPLDLLNTDLQDTHPRVVLTYRAADQGTIPPYLQVYVLGDLTAGGWTMTRATATSALGSGGVLPRPPGLIAGTPGLSVDERITLASGLSNGGNTSYLPLPYPSRQGHVAGTWRVDPGSLLVHSTDARLAGLQYTVIGREISPSPQQLQHAAPPPAALAPYLKVPPAFDRLEYLVDQIGRRQASPYGKAAAIQAWFHRPGNFTYSLTANPGTLTQFLTKTKTGSCQQFAFGMAVLARLAGIPSRVVIGFTQGTYLVGQRLWEVKTSDAHAWPELYFSGAGWLGFEPTPPNQFGPAGQGTATVPPYTEPQQFPHGGLVPQNGQRQGNLGSAPAARGQSSAKLPGKLTSPLGGSGGTAARHHGGSGPLGAVAIVLLAVLLLMPGAARVIMRRWRWRNARDDVARAHVAWRELREDLADHRVAWQASESPRALARRIAESLGLSGAEREALVRVARAEERASYAASPADSAQLRADVALVRRSVIRASRLPARWSARVVPSSVLAPARAGLRHAFDAFARMELAVAGAVAHATFRRRAPRPHGT